MKTSSASNRAPLQGGKDRADEMVPVMSREQHVAPTGDGEGSKGRNNKQAGNKEERKQICEELKLIKNRAWF